MTMNFYLECQNQISMIKSSLDIMIYVHLKVNVTSCPNLSVSHDLYLSYFTVIVVGC